MLKTLIVLLLLYFVYKATRNLIRVVLRQGAGVPPQMPPGAPWQSTDRPSNGYPRPSSQPVARPAKDVEDARWEDV
jgi:hypothetical protein